MKSLKKKIIFLGAMVASLALVACNGGGNGQSSSRPSGGGESTPVGQSSEEEDNLPEYEVKIVGADGAEISKTNVKAGQKITKPADPTAPSGQQFYGWMNVKNGGQIWDFEDDTIGVVMEAVELKPLFVPAGTPQVFEAELCKNISETIGKDGTPGMDGVTYSGGQKGLGLIGRDYYEDGKNNYAASGLYKRDDAGVASYATQADLSNPDISVFGGFVHYNYEKGNKLTWKLNSSAAATNVVIFMRVSGEYGLDEPTQVFQGQGESRVFESYTDTQFPVKVNGTALQYGKQTIHNIIPKEFIKFQDYFLSASVSLQAGENTIEMIVDNTETLNGTIASTAPVVDCIKVISSSTITWEEAKLAQMNYVAD